MSEWLDIHSLADGQLEGQAKADAQALLLQSDEASAEFQAIEDLKLTLAKCDTIACDDAWQKCRKRLDEMDRAKRVDGFVTRYSWAICGVFLLAILVGAVSSRLPGAQLDPAHVARNSASMSPIPMPSGQSADQRRQWFDGLFDAPPPVRPEMLNVVGVAKGSIDGYRAIRFDLSDSTGTLTLFVIPNAGAGETIGYSSVRVQDTNGIAWSQGGHSFMLFGSREPDRLAAAANALRTPR